jgi:hypothetical protein
MMTRRELLHGVVAAAVAPAALIVATEEVLVDSRVMTDWWQLWGIDAEFEFGGIRFVQLRIPGNIIDWGGSL